MQIHFVTGNRKKYEEAALAFSAFLSSSDTYKLIQSTIPLIEIQGTPDEIAKKKADDAFKTLQMPCLIDDVSVEFMALNKFPGPYIRHLLEAIGEDGIWNLIKNNPDKRMHVLCTLAFKFTSNKDPLVFSHTITGTIVSPSGNLKHGTASWNAIFKPDGYSKRYAEMTLEELATISCRANAIKKFIQYLTTNILI